VAHANEERNLAQARELLSSWLVNATFSTGRSARDREVDLVADAGGKRLVVEFKGAAGAAQVDAAVAQLKAHHRRPSSAILVVAVPFMGEAGKRICQRAGVSWFDLTGNSDIAGPGLRILIEGKPNRFLQRGKPSSVFAPKSARIARHLLIEPQRFMRQTDLARETGLDPGFTSKIVSRLEEDRLVERSSEGAVRASNPDVMLDAWAEVYDFAKHSILRGHVTGRASEDIMAGMGRALDQEEVRYAATGLAAAWLHNEFAGYRLVTLFVERYLDDVFLHRLGFREEPRGANVWLVIPNDDGVFDGVTRKQRVACVHPVQAYLDLAAHPERAKDAAAELRARMLQWKA
jgi:hypothetical protein